MLKNGKKNNPVDKNFIARFGGLFYFHFQFLIGKRFWFMLKQTLPKTILVLAVDNLSINFHWIKL